MLLEAIILGLVQGLTEFLPISSSAHLRIVGEFLPAAQDPGAAFTAITQIGTEAAVVLFFWRDIVRIITRWFQALFGKIPRNDPDARMGWLIIVGSIPIVVLGLLFQDQIETTFRSLWLIAGMLIFFGVLLGIADHVGAKKRQLKDLTDPARHHLRVRAGSRAHPRRLALGRHDHRGSVHGLRARGGGSLRVPARDPRGVRQRLLPAGQELERARRLHARRDGVATVVAFFVALGVIAFFMSYISKRSFLPFVIYRVALGTLLLVLLSTGVLQAY